LNIKFYCLTLNFVVQYCIVEYQVYNICGFILRMCYNKFYRFCSNPNC